MSVKTLVALPAEKKRALRRQTPVKNVVLTDWDSLNEGECKTLVNYQLVIACPYIAEFRGTVLGNGDEAVKALRSYLQAKGERNVIFLLPTQRYILRQPYDYMLGQYTEIMSKKQWRENPRKAWETITLPRTLALIETCIGLKVWFEGLEFDQGIAPLVSGNAAKLLTRYLDKRAPKSPPYEIIVSEKTAEDAEVEDIDDEIPQPPGRWNHNSSNCIVVEPLAYYEINDDKYAAVKITTERGGVAILLPFDANNITRRDIDVERLLKLHDALQSPVPEEKRLTPIAESRPTVSVEVETKTWRDVQHPGMPSHSRPVNRKVAPKKMPEQIEHADKGAVTPLPSQPVLYIHKPSCTVRCLQASSKIDRKFPVTAPQEFTFLCILAEKPCTIVSSEEIVNQLVERLHILRQDMPIPKLREIRKRLRNTFRENQVPVEMFDAMIRSAGKQGYILDAKVTFSETPL
jgi:hypothetical protein